MFKSLGAFVETMLASIVAMLVVAAFVGVYGHVVYIIFKWGWNLVG
jgi:hypothetical protein